MEEERREREKKEEQNQREKEKEEKLWREEEERKREREGRAEREKDLGGTEKVEGRECSGAGGELKRGVWREGSGAGLVQGGINLGSEGFIAICSLEKWVFRRSEKTARKTSLRGNT